MGVFTTKSATLAIGIAIVGMTAVHYDRKVNYVDAEAVIRNVSYECTIEKGKRYIATKDTKDKALYGLLACYISRTRV